MKVDLTVPQIRAILHATGEALAGDPEEYWEQPGLWRVMQRGHDKLAEALEQAVNARNAALHGTPSEEER